MKLLDYIYIPTKPKRQAILAMVLLALMFIIPVAQALHLSEHDIFSNDYDCLVCHAVTGQDDFTASTISCNKVNYQTITFIDGKNDSLTIFPNIFHDTIRAPPTL